MLFRNNLNLLPKELVDRVALKTLLPNIKLLRFQGVFKKLKILIRLIPTGTLLLYLLGYHPMLSIPPFKKAVVEAQTVGQRIDLSYLKENFQLPHPGYLSTRFSQWHPGVDIATGLGMPIHPILSGKVAAVVVSFWGLGNYVTVDHGEGIKSTYGHMGRVFVKEGQIVNSNSIIGSVGLTGRSSGAHTHLEVTKDGIFIDPQTILPTLPDWPDPKTLEEQQKQLKKVTRPTGGKQEAKLDIKKELKFNL